MAVKPGIGLPSEFGSSRFVADGDNFVGKTMMAGRSSPGHQNKDESAPFSEANKRLLLPLQNHILVQAAEALARNQLVVAESLVSKFLKAKPRDASALNLMADIARCANRFEDAEQLLSRCVSLSPDTEGFRYNYAAALRRLHKYEEALVQLDQLLTMDPGNALYRDQKATVLTAMGRHTEALVHRRELAEEFPQSPDMLVRYAHALRGVGLQTECIAAYRKTLEVEPSFEAVYSNLASLKVYRFTDDDIEAMERRLKSAPLSSENRACLHSALGMAYGDLKRYDKSFENYARANALRRIQAEFDIGRVTATRKATEAFFSESFFRERAGWGYRSNAPIFIVGLPRSGSTLLEQIVSSHSAIEGLGELEELDTALVRLLAKFRKDFQLEKVADGSAFDKLSLMNVYMQIINRLDAEQFASAGELYLKATARRRLTDRPFFTDKALANYFFVGLIHLILPNSKIVDIRRHPLDCGWSCFKSQFPDSDSSLRLSDIGQDYVNYVGVMAHFDKVLPGRIYRIFYERLIADTETELRRLFDYVGMSFEEQCLQFYENKRPLKTQSSEQVRMPLFQSGVGQWRAYEPWLGPLKSALGSILDCYPNVPE